MTKHEAQSLCSCNIRTLLLSGFKLVTGQVGPNLAYLILRIIPSVLCIVYDLNNIQGLSLSRLAWDTISREFEEFVLYVKACPLPGKCLDLR